MKSNVRNIFFWHPCSLKSTRKLLVLYLRMECCIPGGAGSITGNENRHIQKHTCIHNFYASVTYGLDLPAYITILYVRKAQRTILFGVLHNLVNGPPLCRIWKFCNAAYERWIVANSIKMVLRHEVIVY